jgi:hypothetical protein
LKEVDRLNKTLSIAAPEGLIEIYLNKNEEDENE